MGNNALYIDIYHKILESIENGEYTENAPLPSERVLCNKYHVSRSTIRQSMELLKKSDIIYTTRGSGTFVKPQVFTQPLTGFYSFGDTLKRSNIIIQNSIIDYQKIEADSFLAAKTGFKIGDAFHKIIRLRSAKEYPLMIETTYLPVSRFIKMDLEFLGKGSLYEFLRNTYNFTPTKIKEYLHPIMPSTDEKSRLQMPMNTPCILLERFSYEDDIITEYTSSIVRGDKYIFHVELNPR